MSLVYRPAGANPFRSLVPGPVKLSLVRSQPGIVLPASSRSEECLLFTPRRTISPITQVVRQDATRQQFSSLSAHPESLFLRRCPLPYRCLDRLGNLSASHHGL